ncbi:hypothetical protein AGMMS50267_14780 [Spirochaetia bacterium]|nr:hypothetical protein AGMMS50267_14780 [Spirochaetia bacterium]
MEDKIKITEMVLKDSTDEEIDVMLTQYVYNYLDELTEEQYNYQYIQKIKPAIMMYYATGVIVYEVENGGFNQFLFNSSRYFIFDALEGYKLFGWNEHYNLILEIIKEINPLKLNKSEFFEYFDKIKLQSESYKSFSDKLNLDKFDEIFYKINDDKNIFPLLIEYVRNHYGDFVP